MIVRASAGMSLARHLAKGGAVGAGESQGRLCGGWRGGDARGRHAGGPQAAAGRRLQGGAQQRRRRQGAAVQRRALRRPRHLPGSVTASRRCLAAVPALGRATSARMRSVYFAADRCKADLGRVVWWADEGHAGEDGRYAPPGPGVVAGGLQRRLRVPGCGRVQ
eukprot:5713970-Pyramimonas_sp.AAC.1